MKNYATGVTWWKQLVSYFEGYPLWLVEFGLAAVIGFVVGFLIKNFGKYILFIAVTLAVAAYILNYFSLATFHLIKLKQTLGLVDFPPLETAFQSFVVWVRLNIPICVGALIGFMLGWRVGR